LFEAGAAFWFVLEAPGRDDPPFTGWLEAPGGFQAPAGGG